MMRLGSLWYNCIYWLIFETLYSYKISAISDLVIIQPRSQGSLLPALFRSVGRVGENPGNEVGHYSSSLHESKQLQ